MDTAEGLQSRQMHMDDLNKIIMFFQKIPQRLAHDLICLQSSNVNLRLWMCIIKKLNQSAGSFFFVKT